MSTAETTCRGVLELHPRGHGVLRDPARNFKPMPADPSVSAAMLAKFGLRQGAGRWASRRGVATGRTAASHGADGS